MSENFHHPEFGSLLKAFKEELRKIKERLGNTDATLFLLDPEDLDEQDHELWECYKTAFSHLESALKSGEEADLAEIITLGLNLKKRKRETSGTAFTSWMGNRIELLKSCAEDDSTPVTKLITELEEEKQRLFS